MHRSQMVVRSNRLNDWVMFSVLMLKCVSKLGKRPLTFFATLCPAVPWNAEIHILIVVPNLSWRAVIIVRACDDLPMNPSD